MRVEQVDCLVLGSGISGLSFACKAGRCGRVVVLTKKDKVNTATNLAQGGIAAVISRDDSVENHIRDTERAGGGLSHPDVVKLVVGSGLARVQELVEIGVEFAKTVGGEEFDLGREGGHSARRIAHAQDLTGREIERALLAAAGATKGVEIHENQMAIDLLVAKTEEGEKGYGAVVFDSDNRELVVWCSPVTVLCTGGVGKVYLYTTNPDIATGDGVSMAFRAGVPIANLEFMQFHPTCLYHPQAKNFLISEAVRGEGGVLIDRRGKRFMEKYDTRGELATRDMVARAIDTELKQSGDDSVFLDISHKNAAFVRGRFPHIYANCLKFGIDITREPIPVVPAAHYMCGGIVTDQWGKTALTGLYALGECACTGLHGANRLASNSLLEGVVFAHQAYLDVRQKKLSQDFDCDKARAVGEEMCHGLVRSKERVEGVLVSHNWDQVRRLMWNYVGIVRTESRLQTVLQRLELITMDVEEIWESCTMSGDMAELRNICLLAKLITQCALTRKESRGLHYIKDYPVPDNRWLHDTVIVPENKLKVPVAKK